MTNVPLYFSNRTRVSEIMRKCDKCGVPLTEGRWSGGPQDSRTAYCVQCVGLFKSRYSFFEFIGDDYITDLYKELYDVELASMLRDMIKPDPILSYFMKHRI